jgi:hypothetical protein
MRTRYPRVLRGFKEKELGRELSKDEELELFEDELKR